MAECMTLAREGRAYVVTGIRLSRRNLMTLLAKLDGFPSDSNCEIRTYDGFRIIAEEDYIHYADRSPGLMHPDTEEVLHGS